MTRRPHAPPAAPRIALAVALALLTIAVFWPITHHPFIQYDDEAYVVDNPEVRGGLTPHGIAWALTTGYAGNWHPLTWLSHQLDVTLFGLDPGAHHRTSLLLHVAAVLLLFEALCRMTADPVRSAFVAAVFAVHPLHVESVAWVAERKDVLSGLFFALVLLSYERHARAPSRARMAWVGLSLALGLMAKPMLVTAPFVLLLLDAWPLGRAAWGGPLRALVPLVREKLPLFALSAASSVVTFLVQQRAGAVAAVDALPLGARLENALVSLAWYPLEAAWPSRLAVLYPHPADGVSAGALAASGAFVLAATIGALALRRRAPWLPTGWFWYVGMLVPVLGLLQVGSQARADRYTYLPLIGLALAAAWSLRPRARPLVVAFAAAASVAVLALALAARIQVATWRDSTALFERALAVTENNFQAHDMLGVELARKGRLDEAARQFERAIRINPRSKKAWNDLCFARGQGGAPREALAACDAALRLEPDYADALQNLGVAQAKLGDLDAAVRSFERALAIEPGHAAARRSLEIVRARRGALRPPP